MDVFRRGPEDEAAERRGLGLVVGIQPLLDADTPDACHQGEVAPEPDEVGELDGLQPGILPAHVPRYDAGRFWVVDGPVDVRAQRPAERAEVVAVEDVGFLDAVATSADHEVVRQRAGTESATHRGTHG